MHSRGWPRLWQKQRQQGSRSGSTVTEAGGSAEIDVQPDIHKISGRNLSYTAIGGDFEKGEQIYELQSEVAKQLFLNFRNPAAWIVPNCSYGWTARCGAKWEYQLMR